MDEKQVTRYGIVSIDTMAALQGDLSAIAVYAALASWRNGETNEAWPSRPQLAERLGVSEGTVWRALRRIVAAGLVTSRPLMVGNAKRGTVYTFLATDNGASTSSRADATQPRADATVRRGDARSTRARERFPRKEQTTMNKQEIERVSSSSAAVTPIDGRLIYHQSIAEQLVDLWAEVTGVTGRHRVTPKREKIVRDRLANYDVDDLADALRGLGASTWHGAHGCQEFERALGSDDALEGWRDKWRTRRDRAAVQPDDEITASIRRMQIREGRA